MSKFLRRVFDFVWLIAGGYGALVTLFLVLRVTVGETFPLVGPFNYFILLFLFGGLILLIVSLLFRRLRVFVLQLPTLLAFILMYGNIPSQPNVVPGDIHFTLLAFNTCVDTEDPTPILDIIRAADADVVALPEINGAVAQAIEVELADNYPYRVLHPDEESNGQAVLSRFPILDDEYWLVVRGHQRVTIDIDGEEVVLYSVHPTAYVMARFGFFTPEMHNADMDDILARATQETDAVILAGDFNFSDQSESYARVRQHFGDAHQSVGAGLGLTAPSAFLYIRPDQVFYSDDIIPIDAQVWNANGGSDHYPVLVNLSLRNGD